MANSSVTAASSVSGGGYRMTDGMYGTLSALSFSTLPDMERCTHLLKCHNSTVSCRQLIVLSNWMYICIIRCIRQFNKP